MCHDSNFQCSEPCVASLFYSLSLHFQALHELLARLQGYDLQMHSVVAHTLYRSEARISTAQNIGVFVSASDKASDWSEGWTNNEESLPPFSLKWLNDFPSASNPTKLLISNSISSLLISLFILIEVTSRPIQIKDPNCSIPSLGVSVVLILWLHRMRGLSVHICDFSLFNPFFASFS